MADPAAQLGRLCKFLGIVCNDDYLTACASILWPSPSRSRDTVEWTPSQRQRIQESIESIRDLAGYSFAS